MKNLQGGLFFEETKPTSQWDYTFIEYYRKAYENVSENPAYKQFLLMRLRKAEARRDYYTGLIKEFKNFTQLDSIPNHSLKEAKWEVYKVTIACSFNKCPLFKGSAVCNHIIVE